MAGANTPESGDNKTVQPAVTVDSVLFRMPTTTAGKDVVDKPAEAPATGDVTVKLQSESPYSVLPPPGDVNSVARIEATRTPTGAVTGSVVNTADGPQNVTVHQKGEQQTIYTNTGTRLYENGQTTDGKPLYSAVKPEPTATSIRDGQIAAAQADTRAIVVPPVVTASDTTRLPVVEPRVTAEVPRYSAEVPRVTAVVPESTEPRVALPRTDSVAVGNPVIANPVVANPVVANPALTGVDKAVADTRAAVTTYEGQRDAVVAANLTANPNLGTNPLATGIPTKVEALPGANPGGIPGALPGGTPLRLEQGSVVVGNPNLSAPGIRAGDGALATPVPANLPGSALRGADGQPIVLKPGEGITLPGTNNLGKAEIFVKPGYLALKPGDLVSVKPGLVMDEAMQARMKDLAALVKPGMFTDGKVFDFSALVGRDGKPIDLTALIGRDGKIATPLLTGLLDAKGEIKLDLNALNLAASKPGSNIEIAAIMKGLGLDNTRPSDIKGLMTIDAKTLATLDPKTIELLVKAQVELTGKTVVAAVLTPGAEIAGIKGDIKTVDAVKGLAETAGAIKAVDAKGNPIDMSVKIGKDGLPLDARTIDARILDGKTLAPDKALVPGALEVKIEPKTELKSDIKTDLKGDGKDGKVDAKLEVKGEIKLDGKPIIENAQLPDSASEVGRREHVVEMEDGGEEARKEEDEEKRLAIAGQSTDGKGPFDWDNQKESEEDKLEEELQNNARRAMLAAMLAQAKTEEERREIKLLIEENNRKGEDRRRRYVVKDKDTLESIAKKQLRDIRLSVLIYEINKHMLPVRTEKGKQVVDPRPGTSIWLPSEADIKQFRSKLYADPGSVSLPQLQGKGTGRNAGNAQSAEEELEEKLGANWDGKKAPPPPPPPGMSMGAAVAKNQSRRANIEKILGPMGQKGGDSSRIRYIVRLSDSLDGIALKHPALKDASLWPLIAQINELSEDTDDAGKPTAVLRRGMVLNLPTPFEINQYRNSDIVKDKISDELSSAMSGSVSQVLSANRNTQILSDSAALARDSGGKIDSATVASMRDFLKQSDIATPSDNDEATPSEVEESFDDDFEEAQESEPEPQISAQAAVAFAPDAVPSPAEPAKITPAVNTVTPVSEPEVAPYVTPQPPQISPVARTLSQALPTPAAAQSMPTVNPQPVPQPAPAAIHPQPQSAPVTQPLPAPPGMEILQREPIIAGDRLMWELYNGIRLVKSSVKWEPAIGVFRAQLEMLIGEVWYPVIFYEAFPTGAVRHEYAPGGKRKSVRIDLPPSAVQELADNDLVSKWMVYCRNYLGQIQAPG